MKKIAVGLLLFAATAAAAEVEDKEVTRKSFKVDRAAPEIVVDDVSGNIHLRTHTGSTVEAVITRTIHARSADRLTEAKQDVKLDIEEKPGMVRMYVDGPFRCGDGRNCDRGRWFYGYEVSYDFELTAPVSSKVYLRTVNGQKVDVSGTTGDFEIHNVNGSVELSDMGGSGKATTVNGSVIASFTKAPDSNCSFGTINGKIVLSYPKNLSADVKVKTMHGEIYTDFPATALASSPPEVQNATGRFVYRSDRSSRIRIGNGGPELSLSTINGDVEIRQR